VLSPSSITVCIINYQGCDVVEDTLRSILDQDPAAFHVILVDNASTDGSADFVRARFPEVEILSLPVNRGPGPAREAGFKAARTRYVCLIDNDVMPHPDCLVRLRDALIDEPQAALAMPRIVHAHDPEMIQFDGAHAHFLGVMVLENSETPLEAASSDTHEIGSIISACFLVDRLRWGDQQLQNDDFFIYHEDHDLGLRARQLGHRILSVPTAICRHGNGTAGVSIRSTGMFTSTRIIYTIANRWRVILMRYQLRTIVLMAPTLALFEVLQFVGSVNKGWHGHWLAAVQKIWDDRGKIIAERRSWQEERRAGDGHVLNGGNPPFHPALLNSRIERLGYWLLGRVGRLNWLLARPWLSHAKA
jgi:GT2 family glycosyltransferase